MKQMTKFVVVERGYQYNDENYLPEDGGEPVIVFDTLAEAEAEVKELNENSIHTHSHLYEYPSEWDADEEDVTEEEDGEYRYKPEFRHQIFYAIEVPWGF